MGNLEKQKWEYSVLRLDSWGGDVVTRDGEDLKITGRDGPVHEYLNRVGREGWRMVGTWGRTAVHIILERSYREAADEGI